MTYEIKIVLEKTRSTEAAMKERLQQLFQPEHYPKTIQEFRDIMRSIHLKKLEVREMYFQERSEDHNALS